MKKVLLTLALLPISVLAKTNYLIETEFEKAIKTGNISAAEELVDHEAVKRSHIAALSHIKGSFMSLRSELSGFGKQIDSEGEAIAASLDGASMNMSINIRKTTSPNFDTRVFIQEFLKEASHEDCTRNREEVFGVISIQNLCPAGEIVFRLEASDGKHYLTGVKTAEVNAINESIETISQGKIFL